MICFLIILIKVALFTAEDQYEQIGKLKQVIQVFSFILHIVSSNLWHENESKQMDTAAFDLQDKRPVQPFYILILFIP